MAGNKKEIIRNLKLKLVVCTSNKNLAEAVLEPLKQQVTQRGARMQHMLARLEAIRRTTAIDIPKEIYDFFDNNGVPK